MRRIHHTQTCLNPSLKDFHTFISCHQPLICNDRFTKPTADLLLFLWTCFRGSDQSVQTKSVTPDTHWHQIIFSDRRPSPAQVRISFPSVRIYNGLIILWSVPSLRKTDEMACGSEMLQLQKRLDELQLIQQCWCLSWSTYICLRCRWICCHTFLWKEKKKRNLKQLRFTKNKSNNLTSIAG